MKDYRITWLRGHKFTTWLDRRRPWSHDLTRTIQVDHPDGTRTYPDMTDAHIRRFARDIADSIIANARNSGPDPIAWVTGNSYMPPLRSFDAAENVWQHAANDDGEAFAFLAEEVERLLSDANVALECPDWDNALYAVDLTRFEYTETPDGDTLQDDWTTRRLCAICQAPLERVDVNGPNEYVHAGDEPEDDHTPVLPTAYPDGTYCAHPDSCAYHHDLDAG